jgi:hypothetical protein
MADSESEIGFAQLGLGNVLKQDQLAVPPNQRDYAWTTKEVRMLFQDLARAIVDEPSYFLGTIVTIPRTNGVLEVVDGQQRLATTAILLAAMRDYLREKEPVLAQSIDEEFLTGIDRAARERVLKLRLNLDDNDYFRARLTGGGAMPEATKPSHRLLDAAFSEAHAQVARLVAGHAQKDHGDILNRWIGFVEGKALVVRLRVANEANAYRMFETLNDRGLRTSQSDLVKNYLFGRAGDRLPEVQQRWAFMRGALETMEDEDITIIFLRHALTVIQGFVRETQVYETVQNIARAVQPAVTLASNLEVLANAYVAIHNAEHEKWNGYSDATRKAIEVLNLFDIRPMRALMLSIAQQITPREAERAFKLCVSLGLRLMIAGGTRTGSVEEKLAEAAHKVFTNEITTTAELATDLAQITPADAQFRAAFEVATVSNRKLARYYLRSLEMQAKGEAEPWHIPNDDRAAINLEHILPERPEGNWPQFAADEVRLYFRRIGNLCLLRASENSGLRSEGFLSKKPVYAACPYILTEQIAQASDWTKAEIVERQKTLADLALLAWAMP